MRISLYARQVPPRLPRFDRLEQRGLRWRHVNLVEATLRVEVSKSEEGERTLSLSPAAVGALMEQFTSSAYRSDDDYVFCHPTRGSMLDGKWHGDEFGKALVEAGVEGRIRPFHDMRHTALTNLAASGTNEIKLMTIAGHSDMSTTKQYLHLAGAVVPDDAANLERRMLGVQDSGTNLPGTV